jgi:hypothetical protein
MFMLDTSLDIAELTDAVNAQVAQEYALFGFPDPPVLTMGVVRSALQVFQTRVALPAEPGGADTAKRVKKNEPPLFSPVQKKPDRPSRTDAEFRQDVIDEIRRLKAKGGVLPSIVTWNQSRDPLLPTAAGVCNRLHAKWLTLVGEAGDTPTVLELARKTIEPDENQEPEEDEEAPVAVSYARPPMKAAAKDTVSAQDSAAERADTLRNTIYELEYMSKDGVMPGRDEWDKKRPANFLSSEALMARYDLSWDALAGYAKLSVVKRGRPKKSV